MSRVYDYQTGALLEGEASDALEAASSADPHRTGAVRAERDAGGVWQLVASQDAGSDSVTVYVQP